MPSKVYAAAGQRFELRALLRDSSGNVIPELCAVAFAWGTSDHERVRVADWENHSVWLQTLGPAPTGDESVTVNVQAGRGQGAKAEGRVTVAGTSNSGPAIFVQHLADALPCVAIVSEAPGVGQSTGGLLDYEIIAFVERVELPNWIGQLELQILCAGREAKDITITAAPSNARVDLTGTAGDLSIPVAIWIPGFPVNDHWRSMDARSLALNDLAYANRVLSRNLTGLRLALIQDGLREYDAGEEMQGDCEGNHPDAVAGALNVYYVEASSSFAAHGWSCKCGIDHNCRRNGAEPEDHIELPIQNMMADVLVHEVGHAFGLSHPSNAGISDLSNNLMGSGSDFGRRSRVTLGQIFRLNWTWGGWLNQSNWEATATRAFRNCSADSRTDECPSISHDVR